ncbi:non-hydrolyzing UDP-N-acetylglucosamine 2-epimerase [Elioraea rosea]|uniref:non-hydrolyzing UDP-N-acetylglucosamine 2-epimerase n=1 Tax=Elioraea rosea TaxID=2492390 RepID=UPI0023B873CE|nr:UDP-N-acetylglucosamine 2-epimerase (non-hydrolyzing) [Elioraea rosea]
MSLRVLTVFGTRPEAIKLAPVVLAFQREASVQHVLCVTGQHRQMLDQVLAVFRLTPDHDLAIMKPGQDLTHVTMAVLEGLGAVIEAEKPDWVIVQGDTTTAFAASLTAFYRRVKVAHVEAGLRTGNIYSPWPEEMNRRLTGQIATLHFPPTEAAAANLAREGVPASRVLVTGNTVIDALHAVCARLDTDDALRGELDALFGWRDRSKRLVLVTGHRRENFEGGLERVCRALATLSRRGDVEIVYPVHLNPEVQRTARAVLADSPAVHLIAPLDYLPFVHLMRQADLIVTDSGGIQEEAPGLGKPVLVTRDTTERPEAIAAGTARLVGTDEAGLVAAATELLDDRAAYEAMAKAANPFGDGKAAERIVARMILEGRGT